MKTRGIVKDFENILHSFTFRLSSKANIKQSKLKYVYNKIGSAPFLNEEVQVVGKYCKFPKILKFASSFVVC